MFALNPNVLYLQSTPMTEPLLLATTTVAVAMLMAWCRQPDGRPEGLRYGDARRSRLAALDGLADEVVQAFSAMSAVAFALACLTRYEAWPVTVERARRRGVGALAARPAARRRRSATSARSRVYPAIAIVGFAIFSRVVVGDWFVGSDFFVPENKALGDPMMAAAEIGWGARMLSGTALTWIGGAGVAHRRRHRPRQPRARRRADRAGAARHGGDPVDGVS